MVAGVTHGFAMAASGFARPAPAASGPGPAPGGRRLRRREDWLARPASFASECAEVVVVVAALAFAGWFVPVSYHFFGYVYLLTVTALSLRVGRWPVLLAAIISAVTWNFVFIPPRLSFSVLDAEDSLMLGAYLFAALIGGQLTARIRAQEREERRREQRATALLDLSRALAGAPTFDAAAAAARHEADELFGAQTTLLLPDGGGGLAPHPAGSFRLNESERAVAAVARQSGRAAGRTTEQLPAAAGLYLPLRRADAVLGLFAVQLPPAVTELTARQRELLDGFAAQVALLVEREQLRAAGEREQLLAVSDRLHRTLLDSVSHELKTPLAVLRSAVEKLDTDDAPKRARLTAEVRTATRRLDHLVANLLNQTRLAAGALQPQLDWCDACDLVSVARRAVGDALAGRPVQVDIPAGLPLVRADAVLMEQVLSNLLLNAARHTPPATPVRIMARVTADGTQVALAVADEGPGLAPELQGSLFQKFSRGAGARGRPRAGSLDREGFHARAGRRRGRRPRPRRRRVLHRVPPPCAARRDPRR